MRRVCTGSQVLSLPAPNAAVGTPGYFNVAAPGVGVTPTVPGPDFFNILQEEIMAVLTAGGVAPDNTGALTNQLLTAIQTLARIKINAPLNLYVSTSGSDTNAGTSALPFATVQKAWDTLQLYDLNGYQATINLAAGFYEQNVSCTGYVVGQGALPVQISGPSGVVWDNAAAGGNTVLASYDAFVEVTGGMTLEASNGSGGNCLVAQHGGVLQVGGGVFGTAGGGHLVGNYGGQIVIAASYTITGAASAHYSAASNGSIVCDGSFGALTVTLSGTPAMSNAFATASATGTMTFRATTFTGGVTGTRYLTTTAGGIDTGGQGTSYLPGSGTGTATSPGWYS